MNPQFEMVAKTFKGLEDVLAQELIDLGASNVEPGLRMVSFEGDLEMMYRANLCCRTALRILKPIYKFIASDPDALYDMVKEFDWTQVLSLDKTFAIETTVNSDEFSHSRFVTYRVKDAIVDHFKDKFGPDKRPGVRQDADILINVHISGDRVTLSLDSSGEPLYRRGYRVAQTDAPINEVLAAGIILKTGWRGDTPLVDPMCGSGTFLIEAALIAANINPGVYRKGFAFEQWPDFDADLLDSLYNDDSAEREPLHKIYGADISPKAIAIAQANAKQAGVAKYIDFEIRPIAKWEEAPQPAGVLVTNPPYGERISVDDMDELYSTIGSRLKHVFQGWHAWIIAPANDCLKRIGLTPSIKEPLLNGSIECELREYVIFEGEYNAFRREGGSIKNQARADKTDKQRPRRMSDREWKDDARRKGFGGKEARDDRRRGYGDRKSGDRDERRGKFDRDRTFRDKSFGDRDSRPRRFDRDGDSRPGGKFNRDNRPGGRFDRDSRRSPLEERYHSDRRRFNDTPRDNDADSALAIGRKRNEHALKSIAGRQPSLPPTDGRIMRSRGWKKNGPKPTDDTPAEDA